MSQSPRLTDMAEAIATSLNSAPAGTWSNHTVGSDSSDYVEAKTVLDPVHMFEKEQKGLYIVPVVAQYSRQASLGRQKIISLAKQPFIAICLSTRVQEPDFTGLDIASWEEVKKVLDLREEVDEYILKQDWGITIGEITTEPPQEIPLQRRWILSVTEIEFEGFRC